MPFACGWLQIAWRAGENTENEPNSGSGTWPFTGPCTEQLNQTCCVAFHLYSPLKIILKKKDYELLFFLEKLIEGCWTRFWGPYRRWKPLSAPTRDFWTMCTPKFRHSSRKIAKIQLECTNIRFSEPEHKLFCNEKLTGTPHKSFCKRLESFLNS